MRPWHEAVSPWVHVTAAEPTTVEGWILEPPLYRHVPDGSAAYVEFALVTRGEMIIQEVQPCVVNDVLGTAIILHFAGRDPYFRTLPDALRTLASARQGPDGPRRGDRPSAGR